MMKLSLGEIASCVDGKLLGDETKIVSGVCTDSRKAEAGQLFVALKGEKFDAHDFIPSLAGKGVFILAERHTEGFEEILVPDTVLALGKLGAYWKKKLAPKVTVGVTGSVGKTTTKEMIAGVLGQKFRVHSTEGNFNNHIGLPLTLLSLSPEEDALVCEMGMSARGEISYLTSLARPNLATITNIGTSHIEMLGSRENICEAKLEILEGVEKGSTVILDGDEPLLHSADTCKKLEGYKVLYVGFDPEKNAIYPLDIYKGNDSISFDAITPAGEFHVVVPAVGDHFVKDALFAIAAGVTLGIDPDRIRQGVLSYAPAGLRQKIYRQKNCRIVADCYNASPESMQASLKVLADFEEKEKIAVLGDMLELGDYSVPAHFEVGHQAYRAGVTRLFCLGKAAYQIRLGAIDAGMDPEKVSHFIDRDALIEAICKENKNGAALLFKASRKMKLEDIIAACGLSEDHE